MPSFTPGLAVALHAHGQLGRGHAAQAHENWQAHAPHVRKGLGGGGSHPDRWMGRLIRPGRDRRVVEPIELALVAEGLALPRREYDLQRLEEARLTLLVRHAERVV